MTIGRDGLGDKGKKRGSGGKFNVRQSNAVFLPNGGKFDVNNRKFGATMRQICLDYTAKFEQFARQAVTDVSQAI